MSETMKSRRRDALDSKLKGAGGSIKTLRGAAKMFVTQFDSTSLPDNIGEVLEGVVDIYEANSRFNTNPELTISNLRTIAARAENATTGLALRFLNKASEFVAVTRKAAHKADNLEEQRRNALADATDASDVHSLQDSLRDYSKNRVCAFQMFEVVEKKIIPIESIGKAILDFAASDYPELSDPHAIGRNFRDDNKKRLIYAKTLSRDSETVSTIIERVRLALADAVECKLRLDIEFARERRRSCRPSTLKMGGPSWHLSYYELNPTDELQATLGIIPSQPMPDTPLVMIAPVHHLQEEISMFMSRVNIHKWRNPEFSSKKLLRSLEDCLEELDVARQETTHVRVSMVPKPTHRNFANLAKQISNSREPEPTPPPGRRDIIAWSESSKPKVPS
jgi:hypothetical protein